MIKTIAWFQIKHLNFICSLFLFYDIDTAKYTLSRIYQMPAFGVLLFFVDLPKVAVGSCWPLYMADVLCKNFKVI